MVSHAPSRTPMVEQSGPPSRAVNGYMVPVRYAPALIALCIVLTACGSSARDTTTSSPPGSALVSLERDLEHDYGVRDPECLSLADDAGRSRFSCFVRSEGIGLRLAVTQTAGGRRAVVTGCRAAQREQDQFITCAMKTRPHSSASTATATQASR
jgi:hypothetical protein